MELESLKYVWHTMETPAGQGRDGEEILSLLGKRSRGPVAKMQRNLRVEMILVVATYIPAMLLYFFDFEGRLTAIAWLFFLLLVVFLGYFYRKNKLLGEMQCVSCMVKANLQRQVGTLGKYIRFYLMTGTLMIPFMGIAAFLIIRWKFPSSPGSALFYHLSGLPWWKDPLFWGLFLLPLTIGMYYFNGWYLNRLYGRHIRKLQELVQEMEEG
jgi:hypothetical protein